MTTTITTYSDQAQLALAAYAVNLTPAMDRDVYKTALMANNSMTAIQAERFADRYEIIDSQQNTSSGFAATLFRERVTPETIAAGTAGQYRLAMRGTEFDTDTINDLLVADFGGIATDGIARDQVVDMYNYYQKLITPENANVSQWQKKAETGPDGQPIYYYEKTGVAQGLGKLTSATPVTATGHSLGGHLAAALTRLFPVSSAYTFGSSSISL